MRPSETSVELVLSNGVEELGGFVIRLNPLWFAGIPDRLVLLPGGQVFFIELKKEGKKPARIQYHVLNRLAALGMHTAVLVGRAQVEDWLKVQAAGMG